MKTAAVREPAPPKANGGFDFYGVKPPGEGASFLRRTEIDRRRLGDRLFVLDAELRFRLVAEDHRGKVDRELAYERVVLLHRLDVALARYRDAVLGALELRLQVAEVLVGLELRVVLRHGKEARQRPGDLALGLHEIP